MATDKNFIIESADTLKRKLIAQYVYLMSGILLGYALAFYFIIGDVFFATCTFAYSIILFYTFLIIRKNYNIKTLVHLYLTYASLFAAFVMLGFWKYSAATCMWLLPLPLGAYILLGKKYVYIYSAYILSIIVGVSILTKFYSFNYFSFRNVQYMVISDTFVGIVNSIVFALLLYYNEKIKKVEVMESFMKNTHIAESTASLESENTDPIFTESAKFKENNSVENNENLEKYILLFDQVKNVVEEKALFKDVDFSISQLSNILKTNNLYIAKSIKANGYSNFNHYLNTCRIENVKKLIQENDINKITLMYIYTASGFSNQSTFNRVFKQIEGITPSEYINKNNALEFN